MSGETRGPGDDGRLEFGERIEPVEIQAKHGLAGGARMDEVLARIEAGSPSGDESTVLVAVNRGSSRRVVEELRVDLDRLRAGRTDGLHSEAKRIRRDLGQGRDAFLSRIRIVKVDVDAADDAETKIALQLLEESVLVDRGSSTAAWRVLADDAQDVCARRLRRTRRELVALLEGAGIAVRAPSGGDRWQRQMDLTRELIADGHASAALAALAKMQQEVAFDSASPQIKYRLLAQRAGALLRLDRYDECIAAARVALDYDPDGVHALNAAALAAMLKGDLEQATAFAERAVAAHPGDPNAWSARAQIAAAAGESLPNPGEGVNTSITYRTTLARLAAMRRDWQEVITITSELMAEGAREPEILILRANARLETAGRDDN